MLYQESWEVFSGRFWKLGLSSSIVNTLRAGITSYLSLSPMAPDSVRQEFNKYLPNPLLPAYFMLGTGLSLGKEKGGITFRSYPPGASRPTQEIRVKCKQKASDMENCVCNGDYSRELHWGTALPPPQHTPKAPFVPKDCWEVLCY